MINSLNYSTKKYYENDVLNFTGYRQFAMVGVENKEKVTEKLLSMKEVAGVFDIHGYISAWDSIELSEKYDDTESEDIGFWMHGVAGEIESVVGEDLTSNDYMAMVCPLAYYSDSNKATKIDLTPYVGKDLTLKYLGDKSENPKTFKIKLVGLYDNERLDKGYRECFINYKSLEKMSKTVLPNASTQTLYYELKNIADSKKVEEEMKKMGYWPNSVIMFDNDLMIDSLDILIYISYGLFIASMFIIVCIIMFSIYKNKKNIALSKAFGYSNKNILLNYCVDSISLFLTSVISMLAFVYVILLLFKKYIPLYYKTFKYIKILVSPLALWNAVLTIFILCIIINLISYLISKNKNIKYEL